MDRKKILYTLFALTMVLSLTACSDSTVTGTAGTESSNISVQDTTGTNEQESTENDSKRVASDGADMQTDDKTMPTRKECV